jgi:hypothetical protein
MLTKKNSDVKNVTKNASDRVRRKQPEISLLQQMVLDSGLSAPSGYKANSNNG